MIRAELPPEWLEDWALNALVVLFYLPVALGSLLYLYSSGGEYALVVRTLGEHPWRDVGAGLAAGTAIVVLSQTIAPRLAVTRRMARAFGRVIGHPSWFACAVIAVCSACGEELLFRAVLQDVLGWPIATALFTLAHFPVERDLWPWPLMALPIGLVFAGLYGYTGAALAPIVAHVVINFMNLRWISRLPGSPVGRPPGSAGAGAGPTSEPPARGSAK